MEDFESSLGLRDALELYLFFQAREPELPPGAVGLYGRLRAYLYERLSIEEMEAPQALLERLR